MSVLDNVKVGAHARGRNGPLTDALTLPSTRSEEREFDANSARNAGLRRPREAGTSGRRRACRSARASAWSWLARLPRGRHLLLLDEPAGGLNHEEVAELGTLIRSIRDRLGITVLLVEHHMGLVMSLSDQVVVLNFGRVIADGPPEEVRCNPAVTEAYLGTRH